MLLTLYDRQTESSYCCIQPDCIASLCGLAVAARTMRHGHNVCMRLDVTVAR